MESNEEFNTIRNSKEKSSTRLNLRLNEEHMEGITILVRGLDSGIRIDDPYARGEPEFELPSNADRNSMEKSSRTRKEWI